MKSRRRGPRAAYLGTGAELLERVTDLNGPFVHELLRKEGMDSQSTTLVGDRRDDIKGALAHLAAHVDLIVVTGGLGPTDDDITREVVADFFDLELHLDAELAAMIAHRHEGEHDGLRSDQTALLEAACRQAMVPEGARVLDPLGTAPGLIILGAARKRPTVVLLPGPPVEAHAMLRRALDSRAVRSTLGLGRTAPLLLRAVRVAGSESELRARLEEIPNSGVLIDRLGPLNVSAEGPELVIRALFAPGDEPYWNALLTGLQNAYGDELFSLGGSGIHSVVARQLRGRQLSVGVADAATDGLTTALLGESGHDGRFEVTGLATSSLLPLLAEVGLPGLVGGRRDGEEIARQLAHAASERFGTAIGIGIAPRHFTTAGIAVVLRGGPERVLRASVPISAGDERVYLAMLAAHELRRLLTATA
jgi:molybdenum cofactor synthesis domain-containing protein